MDPSQRSKKRKHGFLVSESSGSGSAKTDSARQKPKKTAKMVDRAAVLGDLDNSDAAKTSDSEKLNKQKAEEAQRKLEALFMAQFEEDEPEEVEPAPLTKKERKRLKNAEEEKKPDVWAELDAELEADIAAGAWDSDGFDAGVGSEDSYESAEEDEESDEEPEIDFTELIKSRPSNPSAKLSASKPTKPKPAVQVIEFHEPGSSSSRPTAPDKSFLASKVSKISAAPKPRSAEEVAEDVEDEKNDRELAKLLKAPEFVESLAAAELAGKERRKYFEEKVVKLGAAPVKIKHPGKILKGMRDASTVRAKKAIQSLRDEGMYTTSAARKIEASVERPRKKKFRPPPNELGTVGRFKNGMLVVSKREIERVEREGKRDIVARKKRTDAFGEGRGKGGKGKGGKKKR